MDLISITVLIITDVIFIYKLSQRGTTIWPIHTSSAGGHRSIAPGFKLRPGYVRRLFHLSLRLITFGGRSAHLAYHVDNSDRKTATVTFTTDLSSKFHSR